MVRSTRELLGGSDVAPDGVEALALSGQSLALVPLDELGELLPELCPIWQDSRAGGQARDVFDRVPEDSWYLRTGNGFPPALYTAFKIMWLAEHEPDVFDRTRVVVGSKDWINFRLTGRISTDHSYASGSGVYDLAAGDYDDELLAATGLSRDLLPEIVAATEVVGPMTQAAAAELGLRPGTPVLAGGVDNSCMAIGARNLDEGELYGSLGSSSWLTVTSARPVLDVTVRPFVFAPVAPDRFHSAVSTFGAGTSLTWVAETLFDDEEERAPARLLELAARSVPGSRGLLFLPTLAGGTVLEGGPNVRGAYIGLDLAHTRADLVRAALEGIAFALRRALETLRALTPVSDEVLVVGSGSKSAFGRQIYADVFGVPIVQTTIDQQAARLGAAAVAAVGTGMWESFERVRDLHEMLARHEPQTETACVYERLAGTFTEAAEAQARFGPALAAARDTAGRQLRAMSRPRSAATNADLPGERRPMTDPR